MTGPAPRPQGAEGAALRPPDQVMRLSRMGAFFPSRLSFMRSLTRRLARERVRPSRPVWEMDDQGFGRAVYTLGLGGRALSLVAFSTPLADEKRTDRVIAEAWDTSYVLFDGVPTAGDLDRLAATVPRQEAGRFSPRELVLSRANRSRRLFGQVVDALAAGRQPERDLIRDTGYLMRTTAVYGNGKFGIADRALISGCPALSGPFAAEMLTVWLIRGFTHDLVEHIARRRNPGGAAPLDPALKRHLGIGNATGLGMAPFLVHHPILIHNWIAARETALARVRALETASPEAIARFLDMLVRARLHLDEWRTDDTRQMGRIRTLRREAVELERAITAAGWFSAPLPWERLMERVSRCSLECQELVVSLLLEPHGALVDELEAGMATEDAPRLDPAMPVSRLNQILSDQYGWAQEVAFDRPEACARFWYVSEEKLEPRLGLRASEPGAEWETPLDIARQVQALARAAADMPGGDSVARLLMARPDLRAILRRVQTVARHPYAEIRDNLIGADCLPIDLLRCKLSFFGATKFDPKSDRWTRITMYQGAPLAGEAANAGDDAWTWAALGA